MTDIESRSKARKIANTRNLAALANDTKWTEFFSEVHTQAIELEIKFIDQDIPTMESRVWVPVTNYIEGSRMGGPELFVFIEWVRSRSIEEVFQIAKKVGLEHISSDKKVIVFGYK